MMLFKYYPDGGYVNDHETLDAWLCTHIHECHPGAPGPDNYYAKHDLGGCCHLELYVESEWYYQQSQPTLSKEERR